MVSYKSYADKINFFRSWVVDPKRVGAVMPSSDSLAHLITREISPEDAPVMELGPGTGVFTRALLARGVLQKDLVLVESGPDFTKLLSQRFPEANILSIDAAGLRNVELPSDRLVGAVVSGLPLLSMPPHKVMAIVGGAFRHIREDGAFYQFTYGLRCPVPRAILDRLSLKATRLGRAIRNIPPAAVYRIARADFSVERSGRKATTIFKMLSRS
ncbi:SAM-dependent methyltransferase [Alphaproteobacteria bacterium]|nr:SAM-dependent methyltransferase [Alphaproteobacteria bacterium]